MPIRAGLTDKHQHLGTQPAAYIDYQRVRLNAPPKARQGESHRQEECLGEYRGVDLEHRRLKA
jgi:hypothetical protein